MRRKRADSGLKSRLFRVVYPRRIPQRAGGKSCRSDRSLSGGLRRPAKITRFVITLDEISVRHILLLVIESFGDSATESIYRGLRVRGLPGEIQERARRKLRMLNQARIVEDLQIPPGNRLEQLKGKLAGFWSIRINQQWRVIFRWEDGLKHEVKIIDYH